MTDRELLELAAKANGIVGEWVEGYGSGDYYYQGNSDGIYYEHSLGGYSVWNPLTDDGDALRLAVALPSCIVIDGEMKWCGVHMPGERGKYDFGEGFEGDPAAATRRAIVRAAAAIGKAMP